MFFLFVCFLKKLHIRWSLSFKEPTHMEKLVLASSGMQRWIHKTLILYGFYNLELGLEHTGNDLFVYTRTMWDIPYKTGMPLSSHWGKGTWSSVILPLWLFCSHEWNPQSPFNPHRGCLLVTREKGLFFSLFQIPLWLPFSLMKACLTGESFNNLLFRDCKDTLKLSWAVDVEKSTTWPQAGSIAISTNWVRGIHCPDLRMPHMGAPDCATLQILCLVLMLLFLFLYFLSL